jgi:hypothetical protein
VVVRFDPPRIAALVSTEKRTNDILRGTAGRDEKRPANKKAAAPFVI